MFNKALTALGYIAYPALLILLWFNARHLLAINICVPMAGFIVVTIFRYIFNAPRPYEVADRPPLINKNTKGRSFPSRHIFCLSMIAYAWMTWIPLIGILLLACSIFLAWVRVALGVHFAKDVIAALITSTLFALLGFVFLPL